MIESRLLNNQPKKEVNVTNDDGKEYTIVFGGKAIKKLIELGFNFDVLESSYDPSYGAYITVLYAGLITKHPNIARKKAKELFKKCSDRRKVWRMLTESCREAYENAIIKSE